jgi:hypothetical protein
MKHVRILFIALLSVLTASLWAFSTENTTVSIDSAKFASQYGVKFETKGTRVTGTVGDVLNTIVSDPAKLAKSGLKGAKAGEVVTVKLLEGKKFKLMHVPSGNEVAMNFNDEIADYGRKMK